jgi:hypothetical protein
VEGGTADEFPGAGPSESCLKECPRAASLAT